VKQTKLGDCVHWHWASLRQKTNGTKILIHWYQGVKMIGTGVWLLQVLVTKHGRST